MKKILLLLFCLFPIVVNADVRYDITDYYIESYILENGDLQVKELFVLDGTFNGYERDIIYTNNSLKINNNSIDFSSNAIYNANGLYNVAIKAKYVDVVNFSTMDDTDFDEFITTSYANNGDKSIYIKTILNNGERYRMYYPSNNNRVAFYISYIIDNAVVIHNDVAELYWNFIGSDYADEIENLNIRVYLPEADASNNFRIWAHGNLTGEIDFLNANDSKTGAIATIDKVEAYDPVDIRITFDKNLIKDTTGLDHTRVNALNKIIEIETERANEANKIRQQLKIKYYIGIIFTVAYIVGIVITFIFVKRKYGTTKKSNFNFEYNREFIDDYNVEVIDYLLNRKNISPNALSASIMNLIYKKNIKALEIPSNNKNKKDYKFILINEENLNLTEQKLTNFLFRNIGKENTDGTYTFTTKELRNYAASNHTYKDFINSYTAWKASVIKDGESEKFYEDTRKAKLHGIIWLILYFVLELILGLLKVGNIAGFFLRFVAIAFLIYTFLIHKKTEKGSLHYDKWMAFKKFLKDFGNFKEKELPEITLWERYLVYAVIFGIADQVEKDMNVKIKEFESLYGETYAPTVSDIYIYNSIRNSVNHSVSNAIHNSYSIQAANSRSSSGTGSGGGFSSGGGFGGGGGGGRGF